jgi:hypothetical protein
MAELHLYCLCLEQFNFRTRENLIEMNGISNPVKKKENGMIFFLMKYSVHDLIFV